MKNSINSLKTYHWIIAIITIPIFIIGFFSTIWIIYSTIIERSGLYGSMYSNYDISKFSYLLILLIETLLFGSILIFQYLNLYQRNLKGLHQTYIVSAVSVVILILLEYYLHTNFIGKG